jgi:two-component system chemotaxis sensor kinase CheA
VNLEKYRALFIEEATDHLAEMGQALVALEKKAGTPDAIEPIDTLFRMAHSVKGMAAALSYDPVSDLAHSLEGWMEPLRGQERLPDGAIPLLFDIVRGLEAMIAQVSRTGESPDPRSDLLRLLEAPARVPETWQKERRQKKGLSPTRPLSPGR